MGFVDDYTVEYSKQDFNINLSTRDNKIIVQNLKNYISAYRPDWVTPQWLLDLESECNDYKFDEIINICAEKLIDFVYFTIESHRRESLSHMREAANDSPEDLRKRIESYLTNENLQTQLDLNKILDSNSKVCIEKSNLYCKMLKPENMDTYYSKLRIKLKWFGEHRI